MFNGRIWLYVANILRALSVEDLSGMNEFVMAGGYASGFVGNMGMLPCKP